MISKLSCLRLPTKSTSRARTAESIPCSSGVEVCHSFVGQDCELSFASARSQSSRPDIRINTVKSADRVVLARLIATGSPEMTEVRIISDLAEIKFPRGQRVALFARGGPGGSRVDDLAVGGKRTFDLGRELISLIGAPRT